MAKVRLGRFWMTADIKALLEVKLLHDENNDAFYDPRLVHVDDEFEDLIDLTEPASRASTSLTTLIPNVGIFQKRRL